MVSRMTLHQPPTRRPIEGWSALGYLGPDHVCRVGGTGRSAGGAPDRFPQDTTGWSEPRLREPPPRSRCASRGMRLTLPQRRRTNGNGIEARRKHRAMTTRHIRWERTGADEHAAAYEEARAALLLGQMVHDRRTELGLTQADLAERAGMTQPQLSRLESGGATPTVPLLARLAAALA